MLYTSFVFTKVGQKAMKSLQDKLGTKANIPDSVNCEESFDISGDFEDEEIYEMCCIVTDCVIIDAINSSVKKTLAKTIEDFNNDEFQYISNVVYGKDFIKEIPGRMYVYIKMNKSVNPMGFYMFMCRDIDDAVCRFTEDEANNILEINEKTDMIETLKYFSDMSPENVKKVVIFAECGTIKIKECIPPRKDIFAEFSSTETDVLAELVSLNPGCIEIHGREDFLKNEISSLIEAVFENRIEYR